ncbi:MsnO8 family LLM class oxidoreductase [Nocardia vaccinii]|uniref:MsnO8 family LLM class oxidoreductase n=1 Tax=Nocardia vaccinii TaxID=1822 RepID=UPI000A006DBA|nr:MsnO8 family LLM class oxidoreductase [Nocardia vaccinii]
MSRQSGHDVEICAFDQVFPFGKDGAQAAVHDSLGLCKAAEELGASRFWVSEHHGDASSCAAPEVLIAAAAQMTRRIRVGTASVLLPYYAPLKVAGTFNMLCRMFPSRIDLGIGRGPGAEPFAAEKLRRPGQVDYSESLRILVETFRDGPSAGLLPSNSTPEIWINGTGERSAKFAAELGLPYCYGSFLLKENDYSVAEHYRSSFVAGPLCGKPRFAVAVRVLTAESRQDFCRLRQVFCQGFGNAITETVVAGFGDEFDDNLLTKLEGYDPDLLVLNTPMPPLELRIDALRIAIASVSSAGRRRP